MAAELPGWRVPQPCWLRKVHLGETVTQVNEPLLPQGGSNRRESSLGPSKDRGHEDRDLASSRLQEKDPEASGGPRTLSERGQG